MKKSTFVALVMGVISGVFFSLGMCMALLTEWNLFNQGIALGVTGLIFAVLTVLIWRKMEKKPPIKISGKIVVTIAVATTGALTLGAGLCLAIVFNQIIWGSLVGIAGIVIMLFIIPLTLGIKD